MASDIQNVSASAYQLFDIYSLPITNSMITSWVFSFILIVSIQIAVKKPKLIPTKGQLIVETMLERLREIFAPIVGEKVIHAAFPLLIGFFTFIIIHNWSGLLPGVGTFGLWEGQGEHRHLTYFFRPANADLNMTLALALSSFIAWLYFIFRYAGPKFIWHDLFGNKAEKEDVPSFIYYFLFPIFFAVGLIELISILFRPISLSFRLFGNMLGGESLLNNMTGLISWIIPIPFYFLEILIGFVQALVFTLLIAVYIGLLCNHEDQEYSH
jgi:F-type H+-transporting ATPase subunit a